MKLYGVLAYAIVAGCSLIVEDGQQCQSASDCNALFGIDVPYLCEHNYCQRLNCTTDVECSVGEFASAVCGNDGHCQPGCMDDSGCTAANVCIPSTHRCEIRECIVGNDSVCHSLKGSTTSTCSGGVCVDPVWSCIGQPDDRPPATLPRATLKLKFLQADTNEPIMGTTVRACPSPVIFGTACTTPLEGVTATQDPVSGDLTISGLLQGSFARILLTPPPSSLDVMAVDYYSQLPMRDVFVAPAPVTSVPRAYLRLAGNQFVPSIDVPDDSAGLFSIAFDCQGNPAREFNIRYEDKFKTTSTTAPTVTAYFSNGVPNSAALATDGTGFFMVSNVKPNINVQFDLYGGGKKMTTLSLNMVPGNLTTVHFFPRTYEYTTIMR